MSDALGFPHRVSGEPILLIRLFGDGEPSIHRVRHEPGDVTRLERFTLCGKLAEDTAGYAIQMLTKENAPTRWHFCRECRRYRGEGASA